MTLSSDTSWADAVQALVSLAAFFALPAAATTVWRWWRYSIKVTMTPIDPGFHGSSNTWQIEILNRSFSKIHSFAAIVIPRRPGINIVFATIQGSNDGGFYMKEAKLSDGAFSFDIERIGPRRRKHFLVRATGTTELLAQGTNIATRNRRSYKAGTASPSDILITSHLRLMILMLYFVLGTLVVIGRLLYLGT